MKKKRRDLLSVSGISIPPMCVYDVPDASPFSPFVEPGYCVFEGYKSWIKGGSTVISSENSSAYGCPGAGYWLCGIQGVPTETIADYLAVQEGFKASTESMCRWLENHPAYEMESSYIVMSHFNDEHYAFMKTITFFVNPDQLSLLLTGAEYLNDVPGTGTVAAPYGPGCGQLLSLFRQLDSPLSIIGSMDIAMREYLPQDIMAFTVTKPMFEQLCNLDESSFLHKSFWKGLVKKRKKEL